MFIIRIKKVSLYITVAVIVFFSMILKAQDNGNSLLFQGLTEHNFSSVYGTAYGNAFVSRSGDINSLFYNAAGLADIKTTQVSVSTRYKSYLERDNQQFYPGNSYLNWSLYMEGLIIPDSRWDGIWSDSLGVISYDSLGNPLGVYWPSDIKRPVQGADEYSKEAADNEENSNNFAIDQISAAIPFELAGYELVAGLSYNRQFDINDFDWNGSHLDPHWGTSEIITAKEGDTTRTNWSTFMRKRTGGIYAISGALAISLSENIQAGIKINIINGSTQESQLLARKGYFLTVHQGSKWTFYHDNYTALVEGSSDFSGYNLNLGFIYKFDNLQVGANVQFPYTINRTFNYVRTISDPANNIRSSVTEKDEVEMPAIFTVGATFSPAEGLRFSFDYETTPLNRAKYKLDQNFPDTLSLYNTWVKQVSLRFGLQYDVNDFISILGGYQSKSAEFIPYGSAIRDSGPNMEMYSFGISLNILYGKLDLGYSFMNFKYYDAYMTNRNFTLERQQRFAFGYTYQL